MRHYIEDVINNHQPLKVTRRNGGNFVVVSEDDWEREQETLTILQDQTLMRQIAESMKTHVKEKGYRPTAEEMDEIIGV